MRVMRTAALCIACACALSAVASASAFATENLPHFGKCSATAGGKYKNSGCTKLAGAKVVEHKFEWEALATAVPFTSKKEKETANVVLEAAGNGTEAELSCSGEKSSGEYGPGDQVKNVVLELSGCHLLGAGCESARQSAEHITTNKLHGEPGIVVKEPKEEANIDGIDLRGEESETIAEFECGPGVYATVRGGVVSRWQADSTGGTTGEETNKMLAAREVEYVLEKPRKQVPEEWTPNGEGVSNSKHEATTEHLETAFDTFGFQSSALSLTELESTAGKVKFELRQCESNIVC